MPPVHPIGNPSSLYFVTTSAVEHARVFERDSIKHILTNSLSYLRANKRIALYAYVIMPNHIHMIMQTLPNHQLNAVMRDFKKHTAKDIIRFYQAEQNEKVLGFFRSSAAEVKGQEFRVWEEGYDARDIFTQDFLKQKMEYIHENPCRPHWHLAATAEDYRWSSAIYYLTGREGLIVVDDVRDILLG